MEKSLANKILTLTKGQWSNESPWKGWMVSSPYEISIPKSIESLPINTDFLRALLVQNRNSFEEWGKMDDSKIIIPTIKTYDIVTTFTGSEIVKRDYGHRLTGYDEYDIKSRLNNCDPCWDEGDELDAEWMDREGEWEITDVEQVTEDINRIKQVMGLITEQDYCKNQLNESKMSEINLEDYKKKAVGEGNLVVIKILTTLLNKNLFYVVLVASFASI